MTRAWTRSCAGMLCQKGPDLSDVVNCKPADRALFGMCSLKVSWSSKITPRFLAEADGVIVDEPNGIVKSCCRVVVAGRTRSSVFARLSCRWCSFIHAEMSAKQPEIRAATVGSIWSKWEIELCVISLEIVGENHVLFDGTQWCSVCGEEEGSKNRSLGTPVTNWCALDTSPSPGHPWKTDQIGFKPAKWNPSDVQWWEGGQEDLMITVSKAADRSSRMRTDDLESAFAICRASVTESIAVSVEWPLLKPDCLASSLLFCERNNETWLKTTRSSVLAMNGRREDQVCSFL